MSTMSSSPELTIGSQSILQSGQELRHIERVGILKVTSTLQHSIRNLASPNQP